VDTILTDILKGSSAIGILSAAGYIAVQAFKVGVGAKSNGSGNGRAKFEGKAELWLEQIAKNTAEMNSGLTGLVEDHKRHDEKSDSMRGLIERIAQQTPNWGR
jgi:hypothetical protein